MIRILETDLMKDQGVVRAALPITPPARSKCQVQAPKVELPYVLRGEVFDAQGPVALSGLSYQRRQGRAGHGVEGADQIVGAAS